MKVSEETINNRKRAIENIIYERLKKEMTQDELASLVGTTKSGISRIESGKQNLSLDMYCSLAEALDKKPVFLMEDTNEYVYEPTKYSLKLYDDELLSFTMKRGIGLDVKINQINENKKDLFPYGLELTNEGLKEWIHKRSIPKNREFVNEIISSIGLDVNDTKGLIDISKGLSLNDSYWIVPKNFKGKFENFNLYHNDFSEILSLIAYTGNSKKISMLNSSPELTTGGMLRKAWRFKGKDGIWLYKGGTQDFANSGNEPYSEYYSSQIAKTMGLNAVSYELENWKGILASKCKLFTNEDISYVPIGQIIKSGGILACLEYYKSLGTKFYDQIIDMLVFDALIYNEDRHFGNFGLLRDNKTGQIIAPAPIYDNGAGLLCYAMKSDFENIEEYASHRSNPYDISFDDLCRQTIGPRQKNKLRKLINFKFKESDVCNLPSWRLNALEELIQKRVKTLLSM